MIGGRIAQARDRRAVRGGDDAAGGEPGDAVGANGVMTGQTAERLGDARRAIGTATLPATGPTSVHARARVFADEGGETTRSSSCQRSVPAEQSWPRRVLTVAVLLGVSVLGLWLGREHRDATPRVQVVEVVDGDTVVVAYADGHTDTVRLLGVDTPETKDPDEPVQCYGPEAAAFTAQRLTGRVVRLEFDVERRDRYGRELAYVELDGARFNDELIRLGYARLLVIPPNVAHARTMLTEELVARRLRRGLWNEC